jgi:hypothetical protein
VEDGHGCAYNQLAGRRLEWTTAVIRMPSLVET